MKIKEKVKQKSGTLRLRVETRLCVVYCTGVATICCTRVCMFRKYLRCKFFFRFAPHRHTSHFCSDTHQSCGYANHYRIGYKHTQLKFTKHIITNTPYAHTDTFYLRWESFWFTASEEEEKKNKRKKRKISFSTDSRCELDRNSIHVCVCVHMPDAWKTFLLISIMIWTINKFNSKLKFKEKKTRKN